MVTEKEAKEMWCPRAGQSSADSVGCIASKCMWWRWADKLTESITPVRVHQGGRLVDLEHRRGYCGMAGTP